MAANGKVRAMVQHLKDTGVLRAYGIDEALAAECIAVAQMSPKAYKAEVAKESAAVRREISNARTNQTKASRAVRRSGRNTGSARGVRV